MIIDKSPYSKLPFLEHQPQYDLEFLIAQEVEVKCYRLKQTNYVLVVYQETPLKIWTEYRDEPSPHLAHVSTKYPLRKLDDKTKKQFIENWSILKGQSPRK